jgi:hypothetical protein
MSTMSTPGAGLSRPSAENDVYTALIVVAFLFVLTATIYIGYRAQTLFDTLLPPGGS